MTRWIITLLAISSIGATSVAPGSVDLIEGSNKVGSFDHTEQCIDAALKRGGELVCRTESRVSSASANGACGVPDIGGWTVPIPTPLDTSTVPAADKAQPGSRIYYISRSTGNDKTGVVYYWNGVNVIDAQGNTYGTDPMNPKGIKPFLRWSWVGPRYSTTNDIGSAGSTGGGTPTFRSGYPDWWLFRRSDRFDLQWDFDSFDAEKNQPDMNKYSGLNVPGGRSETERAVVGAYGDPCLPRPQFIHPQYGFIQRSHREGTYSAKHTLYQSLHFDSHDRPDPIGTFTTAFLYSAKDTVDILLEDMWIDGGGLAFSAELSGQFRVRRSLITDSYEPANRQHAQGVWWSGTRDGVLRIEESILLRNGFVHGDPSKMPWPPQPPQTWDIFSRNMYVSGAINPGPSGLFDSVSMMGASGDQWRPGGRLQRNFFYQGYVSLGARGGYADSAGYTGQLLNNVFQRFQATTTSDVRGQPGWGFSVAAGAGFNYIAGNIVTNAQIGASGANHPGIEFAAVNQDCWAEPAYATRSNKALLNIFDTGKGKVAVRVTDGVPENSCFYESLPVPGVHSNQVADNILINDKLAEQEYVRQGNKAPTTTDTVYSNNRMFKTRAEAAAALGWPDPNRTLKTYLISQGVTVTSSDGFPEYFAKAIGMRRGMWDPKWTARPLVNHIHEGFAMPPIGLEGASGRMPQK